MLKSITDPIRFLAKSVATMGGSQNFLNRAWIPWVVRTTPEPRREAIARHILSLSPHYFRNAPTDAPTSSADESLRSEQERNRTSREELAEKVLGSFLQPDDNVLDYGCGPGFLARAVAKRVHSVTACDISRGALACAQVLNPAPNLQYLSLLDEEVPEGKFDLLYSFAVVQHLTDDVFRSILPRWNRALKPGGRGVVHVVCEGTPPWRTEENWHGDRSLRGRIRWRFGLHCFARNAENLVAMVRDAEFTDIQLMPVREAAQLESGDDIGDQHLLLFRKPFTTKARA